MELFRLMFCAARRDARAPVRFHCRGGRGGGVLLLTRPRLLCLSLHSLSPCRPSSTPDLLMQSWQRYERWAFRKKTNRNNKSKKFLRTRKDIMHKLSLLALFATMFKLYSCLRKDAADGKVCSLLLCLSHVYFEEAVHMHE